METINTRQIFLNKLCDIHTWKERINIYDYDNPKELIGRPWTTQSLPSRIIRETESEIIFKQELPKDHGFGWSDRPTIGMGVIKKDNISLIVYKEEVPVVAHPNLILYKKDDHVLVKVMNWRTQKEEYREGFVTDTHMIHANRGERHKPYPMVFVETIFTYWRAGEDGQDEFYDKLNVTGCIHPEELKFNPAKGHVKI